MERWIDFQKKLVPDLFELLFRRYKILQYVYMLQPIGRRALAQMVGLSERVLRSEVNMLKDQQLLRFEQLGMYVTEDGERLLESMELPMKQLMGLHQIELQLKEQLGVTECIVLPGDSDIDPFTQKEMGRATFECIKSKVTAQNIVAVAGGTTMATVAEMMQPDSRLKDLLFVPARGGLGEQVENQANSICAKFAERIQGTYRLLHVSERLSDETHAAMLAEPAIKELLSIIRSSNVVIHGIGDAVTMAKRRNSTTNEMAKLEDKLAVAEAFGYYFDKDGHTVAKVNTIGLQLKELENIPHVISVAGGASKALAISAFVKKGYTTTLITDEGAAIRLLRD
ncbi:MAG: sugar-binding transcriptional regulator [Bacilli bacterium]